MPVAFGGAAMPQSFAASTALNINLALDAGYNLDLSQRFSNYGALQSPLFDQASYLGLANGGRYAGVTYAPQADLRAGFDEGVGLARHIAGVGHRSVQFTRQGVGELRRACQQGNGAAIRREMAGDGCTIAGPHAYHDAHRLVHGVLFFA